MSIESYNRFKDTYIRSDATPSAEDEIYLANNIPTLNNFLEKEAAAGNQQAETILLKNKEFFEQYSKSEALEDIRQRYNIPQNPSWIRRTSRFGIAKNEVDTINPEVLTKDGIAFSKIVPTYRTYEQESVKDIPKMFLKGIDDLTFGILGASRDPSTTNQWLNDVDEDTGRIPLGFRRPFSLTPFGPVLNVVPALGLEYEGVLADNPNLADAGQMAVATGTPHGLLRNTIRKGFISVAPRLGSKSKKIEWADNVLKDNQHSASMIVKRMYANILKGRQAEINEVGLRNAMNQATRDLFYVDTTIMSLYGGFQALEGVTDLEESPIWQIGQIPALIAGSMIIPSKLFALSGFLGIEQTGPNALKKTAWFVTGGGNIDDYLVKIAGYGEDVVKNTKTLDEKLQLASVTRAEYRKLQDFGRQLRDLKRIDPAEYNRHVDFMQNIMDTRDRVAKQLSENLGYQSYDDFAKAEPKIAEQFEISMDGLLVSDSLRAQKMLLEQGNKIPAFAGIDPKQLLEDATTVARQEAGNRQVVATALKQLLPNLPDNSDAKRFLEGAQNWNTSQQNLLDNNLRKADYQNQLRRLELEDAYYDGIDLKKLNLEELEELGDLEVDDINARFDLFDKFGYQPTRQTLDNIKNNVPNEPGLENIVMGFDDVVGETMTPLQKLGQESKNVFFGTFDADKKVIDDLYEAAKTDMKGKNIRISEAAEAFQSIVQRMTTDPSMQLRGATGRLGNTRNFGAFYRSTAQKFVNTLRKDNDKDELMKILAKGEDPADITVPVQKMDAEGKPMFKEDGTAVTENIPITDPSVTASDVADLVMGEIQQGQILDTGIDLADVAGYKSNLQRRARSLYGTPEGAELMDLARDWGVVLEAGSQPYLADENITTFIEANKKFFETWVPTYKQSVGKKLLQQSDTGENFIAAENIMTTFFTAKDPARAFENFEQIFKGNEEANRVMKKAIARHIEKGGTVNRESVVEMANRGILGSEDITALMNATGIISKKIIDLKVGNAYNSLQAASRALITGPADRGGKLLLQNLANLPDNNPSAIYNKIVEGFDQNDVREALDLLAGSGYRGGKAKAKRDLLTIIGEGIKEKTSRLGDQLTDDSTIPKEFKRFANLALASGTKKLKNISEQMQELTSGDVTKRKARPDPGVKTKPNTKDFNRWFRKNGEKYGYDELEGLIAWQDELDSKAFQEVMRKAGPIIRELDPEHYDRLADIFQLSVFMDRTTGMGGTARGATGAVREFSPESIISRIYSINRQVVSPRYVLAEFGVQSLRKQKQDLLKQMLVDPKTPKIVLEVMRGKQILAPSKRLVDKWGNLMRTWFAYDNSISNEDIWNATTTVLGQNKEEE